MRVAVLICGSSSIFKNGRTGDVAGALPKALRRVGVDAFLITPLYLQTKGKDIGHLAIDDLNVEWRGGTFRAKAFYQRSKRFADIFD